MDGEDRGSNPVADVYIQIALSLPLHLRSCVVGVATIYSSK